MSGTPSNAICTAWPEMALDSRILEAIKRVKWNSPTPVQGACIPLALKGRDLAIQSRTGSGKTGTFVIPILQRVITETEKICNRRTAKNPVALILLPSVELCEQTVEVVTALAKYVRPRVMVDNLTSRGVVTKARVAAAPILVTTAALLGKHCRSGTVTAEDLATLRCVVIDEVDFVISIAEGSLRAVQSVLPPSVQTILSSATLTDGVVHIKSQLLHNPVTITLSTDDENEMTPTEGENIVVESRITKKGINSEERLRHYYLVATDECHHHTLLYALYRLGHIKGKTLIFVNEEEKTYKVQSFLAQLGVEALVYDSNLPLNVRVDTLHRFQVGSVGTLVCTDGTLESVDNLQESIPGAEAQATRMHSKKGKRTEDRHDGALQRGIDFSDVRNVVLFDGIAHPTTSDFSRYTHRVGRAGRAGKGGMAITLFTVQQAQRVTRHLRRHLGATHDTFEPFKQLRRQEAAKLQYRVDNVLFSITRSSTRRQRISSVAAELTRSAYLKSHMSQKDEAVLQRILSRSKKTAKCDTTLLDVPHYMHIEGADSAEKYRKRVRARTSSKSSSASQQPRTRSRDPLSRVASAVKMGTAKKRRL
ncbi:ATP-dependent RNA helicase, putative [Trypanosoma cruzi]|nr:ATP-dependent RNA helicase, putative [Trypanosoma cruzi]